MLCIFDKDGTLCRSKSGKKFINSIEDQELIPGVLGKIQGLKQAGHKIAIASNQGGVAFDFISFETATNIMIDVATKIKADHWVFCPYHPKGSNQTFGRDSINRKPNPGMIIACANYLDITIPEDIFYIGDRPEDEQAAANAGVGFIWAKDFFGREDKE